MLAAHTDLCEKGEDLIQQGRIEEALRLYLYLVGRNPEDVLLRNRLGEVLCRLGFKEDAEKFFQGALNHHLSHEGALTNLRSLWASERAYAAGIRGSRIPGEWSIGRILSFPVSIENTGTRAWEPPSQDTKGYSLGAILVDREGNPLKEIGRTPISKRIRPGERITVEPCLHAIAPPGEYEVKFDLLMNQITWFESLGSTPCTQRVSLVNTSTPITSFLIEVTNICNFNCTFCPNESMRRKRGMMERATFRRIIEDLSEMGFENPVGLHLMGEPLLHPRFFEFLDLAREKKVQIELHTNGMRLTDDVLDRIYGYDNVVRFWISLHTPTEGQFLQIRRPVHGKRADLFESYVERTKSAVRKKLSSGSNTDLRIYLMATPNSSSLRVIDEEEQARSHLEQWYSFAESVEREQNIRYDREPVPEKILAKLPAKQLYPLFDDIYVRFVPWHSWGGTFDRLVGRAPECRNPWFQFAVLWNGDCTTCCLDYEGDIKLGNINDHTISDMWNGDRLQTIRRGFMDGDIIETRCRTCLLETGG